jgi:DNA gyrase/topoisomerase IV subunit B
MTALRKNDIQTLGELEYVLKRPGIYIGSIKEELVEKYMYEGTKMVKKTVPFIPGLIKIIEEVIDNSIDESIETNFAFANKISVNYDNGVITVKDNGRGLPIAVDKSTGKNVVENIFTELRTGSNFDDEKRAEKEKKGMNGVGVSLTNIFSDWLQVKTANGARQYIQKFELGPVKRLPAKITSSTNNFTEVSFKPNYAYFEPSEDFMKILPDLIYRVLRNAAFCFPEINFKFNGKKIGGSNLRQFMSTIHPINEFTENEKVRLGVFCSDDGFQHLSFVNGLETSRAGTHIDYVTNTIVNKLREYIKKKYKLEVKPADIRNKLFVLLSVRIPAPDFDGQTKERLITPNSSYNDRIVSIFNDKFFKQLIKNEEIIEPIVESYRLKKQVEENINLKKLSKQKQTKIRVEKYLPATKSRKWLVLTEGDSAKGSISAVLGREEYSYFPLKGKPLNAYEAKPSVIVKNTEFQNIVKITGMRLDKDIQNQLRYENILFATDQDADGSHIKALLLAYFGRFGISLIKGKKIHFLRTPLIAVKKKGKIVDYFFDFETYNKSCVKGGDVLYYKGLGTWDAKDLKEIIKKDGIENFILTFTWDDESQQSLKNWIGSDADLRKPLLRGKTFSFDGV